LSTLAQLIVKIGADVSGLTKGLDTTQQKMLTTSEKMKAMGDKMSSVGRTMTAAVTLPIVGAAAASFKLASDMSESINKVDVAFKDNAGQVKAWSKTTLNSFGIAKGTALDMAAKYGDMATSMGLNTGQAADMSTSLVGLAGDLASFKNIGIDIADTALTSIFTGETESLKQLGIVMTQANLDEFALSQGIKKKTKDLTQAEQVQLRYNYVLAMTKNAQGDFVRTGDGAANQMRIFGESLKELGATMGENLLPVITPIIAGLNNLVKEFGQMSPATQKTIIAIAGIAAAVGPVLIVFGSIARAIASIGTVMGSVTSWVTRAWPIIAGAFEALAAAVGISVGWMVAIVAGLVIAGVLLYKNWDKVKAFGISMWNSISITWHNNMVYLKAGMQATGDAIISVWSAIKGKILDAMAAVAQFAGQTEKASELRYEASVEQYKPLGIAMEHRSHLASGTDFWKGGLSWVGENGPELVNLPRGAQVLNNNKSMAAVGGNQQVIHSGTVIHEFRTNDGQVVKRIAEEFERGNRRIPSRISTMPSMA